MRSLKYTLKGTVKLKFEDCGAACIANVEDDSEPRLFVRLHSWDSRAQSDDPEEAGEAHPEMHELADQEVTITIETTPKAAAFGEGGDEG